MHSTENKQIQSTQEILQRSGVHSSERLASLSIMGESHPKYLEHHSTVVRRRLRDIWGPQFSPYYAKEHEPLGQPMQGIPVWNLVFYTQINVFKILLNQTGIRLYLSFSD